MPHRKHRPSLLPFLLLAALAGAVYLFARDQLRTSQPGETQSVRILLRPGMTMRGIADTLKLTGVIRYPALFNLYARALRIDRVVKTGRFTLPLEMSEYRALRRIETGGDRVLPVTFPEGYTLKQMAARLEANDICPAREFLKVAHDTSRLRPLGIPGPSAEGWLFPSTYTWSYLTPAEEVIATMHERFLKVYRGLLQPGDSAVPNPQVVILASLVEAEAEQDSERPLVASVFLNRLKRGMRLQSCATVQYVLPERKAILSEADTKLASPYNTYLHPGLPPGPVCCPGKPSLQAALYPAQSNYLFFVATGPGRHTFSTSFAAHLAAQRRARQR